MRLLVYSWDWNLPTKTEVCLGPVDGESAEVDIVVTPTDTPDIVESVVVVNVERELTCSYQLALGKAEAN